jgi:16S rRNA (adenine1518-N6/adenine1519-N6)-dimethyltransferase
VGARLGQHFLSDPSILGRIAAAAVLERGDTVLEIGPGKGSLTRALAERASRVTAIETDRALAAALAKSVGDARITIVTGDALKVPWPSVTVVCGNIPYQITSPLIDRALRPPRPARIVFLVQAEVAERLAAAPGSSSYGALSAGVQLVATVERMFAVPAGAFRPRPNVNSAVVRLVPRAVPLVASEAEERQVRGLIQALFQRRRQQLGRSVREAFGLERQAGEALLARLVIAPASRVDGLAPEVFVALARALAPHLAS